MGKTIRVMFAGAVVAALGFGAGEAMAGPAPVQREGLCEDKCYNTHRVCVQYNLGDCERKLETCLNNCAT